MKTIWVSNETMALIRAAATNAFEPANTTPAPQGGFNIEIGEDTYARLQGHQRPGENIDAVVVRAIAAGATKN